MLKKFGNKLKHSLSESNRGHFYSIFMGVYLVYRIISRYK